MQKAYLNYGVPLQYGERLHIFLDQSTSKLKILNDLRSQSKVMYMIVLTKEIKKNYLHSIFKSIFRSLSKYIFKIKPCNSKKFTHM